MPFEVLNPNAVVFEEGDVICYAHRPCFSRLVYNDSYGYWTNRYLIWSPNETIAYVGSAMRDCISFANDDLSGRWNSVLCWEIDPSDGKRKWCLRASRRIYCG